MQKRQKNDNYTREAGEDGKKTGREREASPNSPDNTKFKIIQMMIKLRAYLFAAASAL
jgi:hypothetical protein